MCFSKKTEVFKKGFEVSKKTLKLFETDKGF